MNILKKLFLSIFVTICFVFLQNGLLGMEIGFQKKTTHLVEVKTLDGQDKFLQIPVYDIPNQGDYYEIDEIATLINNEFYPLASKEELGIAEERPDIEKKQGGLFYFKGSPVEGYPNVEKFNGKMFLKFNNSNDPYWKVIFYQNVKTRENSNKRLGRPDYYYFKIAATVLTALGVIGGGIYWYKNYYNKK